MSLLLALLLDALLGEPPARLHPVVLMGRYLAWAWPRVRGLGSGAFYWTLGALLFTLPAFLLDLLLRPLAWGWLLLGLLLKPLFSLRMLLEEVAAVERALGEDLEEARRRLSRIVSRPTEDLSPEEVREAALESLSENLSDSVLAPLLYYALFGLASLRMLLEEVAAVERALGEDLEEARRRLSRIVSRPTEDLSPEEVREAALESLSENLSDSVLAPLLYYALFGLAGAALYRYANTADAMWGYPEHGARGAFAARVDDLLNLLPARLTGLLLCPPRLWPRLLQEARKTPSPNAGFPMAALALRLGVRLRKRGVSSPPSSTTPSSAWRGLPSTATPTPRTPCGATRSTGPGEPSPPGWTTS
ncbi:CobD/CbiB family cobalamin biosynthesis protein [Thermus tengchongensis]|nr:CobD/CbiB family cobalamin biosynthesis protein [Thermus tengchongensis]